MESTAQIAKALFFNMRPERVIRAYTCRPSFGLRSAGLLDENGLVRFEIVEMAAASVMPTLSHEELLGLYSVMRKRVLDRMKPLPGSRLYAPLLLVANSMLAFDGDKLYCKLDKALAWRDVSLVLGQDVIVCAALAWRDCHSRRRARRFDWPPLLLPDRVELRRFLSSGLIENHSHLKGASQSFAVTLAYCANHVEAWGQVEGMIDHSQVSRPHFDVADNAESWRRRLCMLASLRATLFLRVAAGGKYHSYGVTWDLTEYDVEKLLGLIRFQYGLITEDTEEPLDYALHNGLVEYIADPHRLLIAERALVYSCLKEVFAGNFSEQESIGLYVYLLLKAQLRGEFIQVNDRYGFHNFLRYENRKDKVFETDDAYVSEQNRIAVRGAFACSVKGMEARLAPGFTAQKDREKIDKVLSGAKLEAKDPPLFFVFHFIKSPEDQNDLILFERNHAVRVRAFEQAEALVQLFAEEPERKAQVLGVDAASTEIGCRPEVFAPAFSYLRGWIKHLWREGSTIRFDQMQRTPWYTTYHAGEDFYDLVDGIRAVDEAIRFLHMRRGDRIGHALAVGVEPSVHAANKGGVSVVPKQDQLDNIVWLLRFADEEGISVDSRLRSRLEREASQLLMEVYGTRGTTCGIWSPNGLRPSISMEHYAKSWVLREDPPEWYRGGEFRPQRLMNRDWPETAGMVALGNDELLWSRQDRDVVWYNSCYHWDPWVKRRGAQMVENVLKDDYLDLVREVQDAMMRKMARMGVVVECNPSSNCVIGSFRDYAQHPIFRMLAIRSDGESGERLVVTVNTDDIGVFDTALQNEYVLLAAAMLDRGKSAEGSLDIGLRQLEELRRNGFLASFSEQVRMSYSNGFRSLYD